VTHARLEVNHVSTKSHPKRPHDHDQDTPRRRGELIDDERDKKPERDEIPDTPPTEPQPVPVEEPPPAPEKQGPFIAGWP
jgi:hypothetical protein